VVVVVVVVVVTVVDDDCCCCEAHLNVNQHYQYLILFEVVDGNDVDVDVD
jgi:hypothetical protein